MRREEAAAFIEKEHHGVLVTLLPDGRPHAAPIVYAASGGFAEISTTRGRVKTKNLMRDPRAALCVLPESGWYPYLSAEGRAELVEDPDGQKNLALYRRITGRDPDDLGEYLQAMRRERRLIIRLAIERLYPLDG